MVDLVDEKQNHQIKQWYNLSGAGDSKKNLPQNLLNIFVN